jgi:hypothetical protein
MEEWGCHLRQFGHPGLNKRTIWVMSYIIHSKAHHKGLEYVQEPHRRPTHNCCGNGRMVGEPEVAFEPNEVDWSVGHAWDLTIWGGNGFMMMPNICITMPLAWNINFE